MASPLSSPPRATYRDVLEASPNMVAEIIDGTLHTQPRPAPRHQRAASKLGGRLVRYYDDDDGGGPSGWWIDDEPEIHFGEDVVVPDVAGWRRERMPVYPDDAFYSVVPDWVCEVLSPSTRTLDLTEKRDLYAAQGVPHLWFIDPLARTLEAFALNDGSWTLLTALSNDAEVKVAPFDAVGFPLDVLWVD